MDMPKAYNPAEVEDAIYKKWEDSGFFGPPPSPPSPLKLRGPGRLRRAGDKKSVKHFSIVMPPPNVTGTLHVGDRKSVV